MQRPITLFTGQWADLPFVEICQLAESWGYDGLEIACWGDHFEVDKALSDDSYIPRRLELLERHHLKVFAISAHLVGQAVCDDPIDERHKNILPPRIWGDGNPEGVRQRAAEELKNTARAAKRLGVQDGDRLHGLVDLAPGGHVPAGAASHDRTGLRRFRANASTRSSTFSTRRACGSLTKSTPARSLTTTGQPWPRLTPWGIDRRLGSTSTRAISCGRTSDPVGFLWDFRDRIYHVDCKESKRQLNGRNGRLGSHLPWGDPRRGWDFVSTGHGDVPWEAIIRMLNAIGYDGPISIEWEDAGMDRLIGAPEALELIRRLSKISPPEASFDAAFSSQS